MVCNQVRERLSEYLDDVLPMETKVLVDAHLSACAGCRQEIETLKGIVKALNTLQQVAPPDDFLDQIRDRMSAPPWHQRVFRFLFLPLRFKIPMQVAGALTVALLIFSILTLRENESAHLRERSNAPLPSPGMSAPESRTLAKRSEPAQAPSPPAPAASKPQAEKIREAPMTATRERRPSDEAVGAGATADRTRAVALVLRAPAIRLPEARGHAYQNGTDSGKMRLKSSKEAAFDPLVHALKALAARHRGRVLSSTDNEGGGRPDAIEIEIPSSEYDRFYEGLKRLGDIEPSGPGPESGQGTVTVRIALDVSNE